jgi:response regulator of citrate/malate metabolism
MLSAEDEDTFHIAKKIKQAYVDIPIVVLTPFSRKVTINLDKEDLSAIDYVFSWLGNADLLLAIIKLIEDKMNAEHDVNNVGVQTIILVEDSVRFYSSYLPHIYKIIFKQSQRFMLEGLNEHQQMMRMRGRPKILLARNYEEAILLFEKYKKNLLGIISDISYQRKGKQDKQAGIKLVKKVKVADSLMPILLQSSDTEMESIAKELRVGFINKQSKTISIELKNFISEFFAFGDFVFVDPDNGKELDRAANLKMLQKKIYKVPDKSLHYHLERNHISKWLRARALFPLAERFKGVTLDDFETLEEVKKYLFESIANYRMTKARGVIAEFRRESFDEYLSLTRIGEGSLGGKARGLAFLDSMIKRNNFYEKWNGVRITIPKTVVLGTDIFDEFMEENKLYEVAMSDLSDKEILERFLQANLPFRIKEDLYTLISFMKNPLAVRSSSLLEDSYYQPFAGIYSTYMIPSLESDERRMLEMLTEAIKSVYASAYYKDSKAYMAATSNVIDEEKMAIVLQQVVGRRYSNRFYPTISGVARSINFYPIEPEKAEDGIANIALGLGKYIVDGGMTLRFSPKYPRKALQTSTPELALRETQRHFFALDLIADSFVPCIDDAVNLQNLRITEAEKDKSMRFVASTYDYQSKMLRDGLHKDGKKLVTFSAILNHNAFPLAEILSEVLETGQREMGKPIEIEFAVDLDPDKDKPNTFHLLQIRPIVDNDESVDIEIDEVDIKDTILTCNAALGNAHIKDLHDLVYVRPDRFNSARTHEIAERIAKINERFVKEGKNYILVGPGRWGSADPHLGIPVKWPQISASRLIVESGLEGYHIDPSQGTHFFQNLTSFRVGYFTINPFINEGTYDLEFLNQQKAEYEDEFIRHIRFDKPAVIAINGKKNRGVVFKP